MLVRNNPFSPGNPDVLIIQNLDDFDNNLCTLSVSSASRFQVIVTNCTGVVAKVVINGGTKKVSFMFDHHDPQNIDQNGVALMNCLSIIHEIIREGGIYETLLNEIMVNYPNWKCFKKAVEKKIALESIRVSRVLFSGRNK